MAETHRSAQVPGSPGAALWWRRDPHVARIAAWADQDPEAMRRLLCDAELRAQLERALSDVVGPDEREVAGASSAV